MTHAYDEMYLKDTMRNVGVMAHYCINEYGMSPSMFNKAFLSSRVSKQIAQGNPRYLVGYSGKDLAGIVMSEKLPAIEVSEEYVITPEYWAGWILAYYQWYTNNNFSKIHAKGLTFSKILRMYNPLHEADPSKFVEVVNNMSNLTQ